MDYICWNHQIQMTIKQKEKQLWLRGTGFLSWNEWDREDDGVSLCHLLRYISSGTFDMKLALEVGEK